MKPNDLNTSANIASGAGGTGPNVIKQLILIRDPISFRLHQLQIVAFSQSTSNLKMLTSLNS